MTRRRARLLAPITAVLLLAACAACAGVPAPVAVLDAHAAVSGVAIVTGQLGAGVGTAAVVAEWSTGTLMSVQLDAAAPATASTADTFVIGIGKPVAVAVGADGALYAGDWATGTIYRITQAT
jgi:glucose/arabinose dehydrogenase